MAHLPVLPRTSAFAPIVGLTLTILATAVGLVAAGALLLWEASISTGSNPRGQQLWHHAHVR